MDTVKQGPREYKIDAIGKPLVFGRRPLIMGIVNITPDSFSDGGKFLDRDRAVEHGLKLVDDGADILDIGGESTRPFSDGVPLEEEIKRVVPVIEKLSSLTDTPISIDTVKSKTAELAIKAGASIINDVGAMRLDPEMPGVAVKFGAPVILMHMKGTPGDMQLNPVYSNVIEEIAEFLSVAAGNAVKAGVPREKIIVDPGIGFGKTLEHNLAIIKQLEEFKQLDMPLLIGPSRKAFIRNLLKTDNEKDISPALPEVETGTQAAVTASVLNGADIVRVHDVKNTKASLQILQAIINA